MERPGGLPGLSHRCALPSPLQHVHRVDIDRQGDAGGDLPAQLRQAGEQPAQRSEDVVGPYELQDFNLYWILRFGLPPAKVAYLAWNAWHDPTRGAWPDIPTADRRQYDLGEIRHWLAVFLERFFATSQFKRSCVPNAPKVGSGGSLSPRGDWRAPSDSSPAVWLEALKQVPDSE